MIEGKLIQAWLSVRVCTYIHIYIYYIRIFKVLLCICFIPGVCLRMCVLGFVQDTVLPVDASVSGVTLCTKVLSHFLSMEKEKVLKRKELVPVFEQRQGSEFVAAPDAVC